MLSEEHIVSVRYNWISKKKMSEYHMLPRVPKSLQALFINLALGLVINYGEAGCKMGKRGGRGGGGKSNGTLKF